MPIEPFEITTIYPDGTSETRWSTPEEIAQREVDIAFAEQERLAKEAAQAEIIAQKESAKAKLLALGLSEEEVAAIVR